MEVIIYGKAGEEHRSHKGKAFVEKGNLLESTCIHMHCHLNLLNLSIESFNTM